MEENGLQFNTDTLQNQEETYSSLTDLNHIPVFTSAYEQKVEAVNQMALESGQYIKSQIFGKQIVKQQTEEVIVSKLFQSTSQQVIKSETFKEADGGSWAYPAIGIASVLFIVVMSGYCSKRSRKIKSMKVKYEFQE